MCQIRQRIERSYVSCRRWRVIPIDIEITKKKIIFLNVHFRYTPRNVARCWTYETSLLVDEQISNELPMTDYLEFFAPDFTLHPEIPTRQENANSKQYLELISRHVYDNLKMCQHAPSVQMFNIPEDALPEENRLKEEPNPDIRVNQSDDDQIVEAKNEFFDGDQDNDKTENES